MVSVAQANTATCQVLTIDYADIVTLDNTQVRSRASVFRMGAIYLLNVFKFFQ